MRARDRDCEVWFNGDCPVCSYEIGAYEKLAERRDLPLRFHDSMRVTQPLAAYGLRREHLERRLYLRDEQGRILSGFRAVLAFWARLPEYRRLASVFSWPPLRAVCETLYDHASHQDSRIGRESARQEQAHERILRPLHRHRDFLVLSSGTVFAIYHPLRQLLEAVCPLGFTAEFWTRAAVTVIYLLPLWVVLVFGLPNLQRLDYVTAGEIARRALAAASFALVGIVIATGLRLSSLAPPSSYDAPPCADASRRERS